MISRNYNCKLKCMRMKRRQSLRSKLTGKQKMASAKRGKRKSPFQEVVFEVSDDDMSPEHHDNDTDEPGPKVLKLFSSDSVSDVLQITNLDSDNTDTDNKASESEDIIVLDTSFLNETSVKIICSDTDEDLKEVTPEDEKVTVITQKNVHIDEGCEDIQNSSELPNNKNDKQNPEEGKFKEEIIFSDKTSSTESVKDSLICITFNNKNTADLYKFRFIKFLESFIELEVTSEDDLTLQIKRDPLLDSSEWLIVDEASFNQEEESEEKLASPLSLTPDVKPKKKKKKKVKVNKDLFILDTTPSGKETNSLGLKYSSKFQINEMNDEATTEVKNFVSGIVCFNCGSKHSLKDCPIPKDYGKINAARMKMQILKQTVRYHLEPDQKYNHLKPGKISDKLREALELRKNQLPPYIYQMRMLGYPPGWLEEAKLVHSNLDMFDSEGRTVRQANRNIQGLDPERIIDYPGFNVPMAKHVIDEYKNYRSPPYSDKYSKKVMLDYFEKEYSKLQDNLETCDMDLDTTNENNQSFNETKALRNPKLQVLKQTEVGIPSPSLNELEKQKERLLAALEDSISSNITSDDAIEESENSEKQKANVTNPLEIRISSEDNLSDSQNSPVLHIKNSTFGTPILKSSSPYSRLPNPDNFMKDVSPVINFENLPNSTGKYEQMTEVLQKVRSTMKGLQNCKS